MYGFQIIILKENNLTYLIWKFFIYMTGFKKCNFVSDTFPAVD